MAAEDCGADVVATTLYGYTDETRGKHALDWDLVATLTARLHIPVLVEGHVTRPEEMAHALQLGAHAIVVGSAITRPESITARFVHAAAL